MTAGQWADLLEELRPALNILFQFGDETGNFDPWCRVIDLINEGLATLGLPLFDCSTLEFYRQYTAPHTPTVH
jgi:hypothetical protein